MTNRWTKKINKKKKKSPWRFFQTLSDLHLKPTELHSPPPGEEVGGGGGWLTAFARLWFYFCFFLYLLKATSSFEFVFCFFCSLTQPTTRLSSMQCLPPVGWAQIPSVQCGGPFLSMQLEMTSWLLPHHATPPPNRAGCSSVSSHNASVNHMIHQDSSANQNEPWLGSRYEGMASYWEYKTVPVFLVNFLASYLIYYEQCFRSKVIKSTVSMLLIFYCGLMGGEMLSGPHGIFGCGTSGGHWGGNSCFARHRLSSSLPSPMLLFPLQYRSEWKCTLSFGSGLIIHVLSSQTLWMSPFSSSFLLPPLFPSSVVCTHAHVCTEILCVCAQTHYYNYPVMIFNSSSTKKGGGGGVDGVEKTKTTLWWVWKTWRDSTKRLSGITLNVFVV